jgi:hypothetical protein
MPCLRGYDGTGSLWEINPDGLTVLVRQYVFNTALKRRSRIKRVHNNWGPDEVSVETDFNGLSAERDRESRPAFDRMMQECLKNGSHGLDLLLQMRHETEDAARELREMQRATSREMSENIERSIRKGEIALEVATAVRDISATTLVVGSTVMSGGAAVAVLGGGSVLKGVAKFEDGGSVGSALMTATGTFVVGVIGLKDVTAAATGAQKMALTVVGSAVDAQFEAVNALIDGKSGREAIAAAAGRAGTDLIGAGLGPVIERITLPVIGKIVADEKTRTVVEDTAKVAIGLGMSAAADQGVGVVSSLAATRTSPASQLSWTDFMRSLANRTPARPTNPGVCDINTVISTPGCRVDDWVRQIAFRPA